MTFGLVHATVSVKIVGTFLCVLLPSLLVYMICRLNRNKQHWEGKGKHGKGKKAFVLTVPTIFVWDCSYILHKWQAVKLTFFAPYYVACQNFTLMKCCSAHNGHWGFPSLSENYGSKEKEKTLRAFHSTKLSKIMETVANGKDISRKSFQKSQKLLNLRNMNH